VSEETSFEDFLKVDLRIGTIIEVLILNLGRLQILWVNV